MQRFDYFKIRNAAWEFLIDFEIKSLPVDVFKIAKVKNWFVVTEEQYGLPISKETEYHNDDGMRFIIYKPTVNSQRLRFGIAHEMGHIVLDHMNLIDRMTKIELEKEAHMFAARLLMPLIVLHGLSVSTAKQISELCDVSMQAAEYRFKRLQELKTRNRFFTSPLEKKVYERFRAFIKS